jgi:hypothetical protein
MTLSTDFDQALTGAQRGLGELQSAIVKRRLAQASATKTDLSRARKAQVRPISEEEGWAVVHANDMNRIAVVTGTALRMHSHDFSEAEVLGKIARLNAIGEDCRRLVKKMAAPTAPATKPTTKATVVKPAKPAPAKAAKPTPAKAAKPTPAKAAKPTPAKAAKAAKAAPVKVVPAKVAPAKAAKPTAK